MMKNLINKNVVITGGNRGLGKAIAIAFAKERANIVITYRSGEAEANETIRELEQLNVKATAIFCDLTKENDRSRLVDESYHYLSDVDILVNNAGVLTVQPYLQMNEKDIKNVFNVNLLAPFFLTQSFAKRMVKQQSILKDQDKDLNDYNIINISSISRTVVTPGLVHYEASKAAISQFSKSISMEFAPFKIRVNDVAPGLVPTDLNKKLRESEPDAWQNIINKIPLERAGTPEEIANAVIFVAKNPWMTGSTLTLDGGRSCQ